MLALVDYIVNVFFSPSFYFDFFSVMAKRLAGKSISDVTYLVSVGTLNQSIINCAICCCICIINLSLCYFFVFHVVDKF